MDEERPKFKQKLEEEIEKDKFKKLMNAVRDLNYLDNNEIEKGIVTTTYHLLFIGIIEKEDAKKIMREILRKYRRANKNTIDMKDSNSFFRDDNKTITKKSNINEHEDYMKTVEKYYDNLGKEKEILNEDKQING